MYPRKDRDEIVATAKDYFGTPIIESKVDDKPVQGCPFDEPIFNPDIPAEGFTAEDDKPIPYVPEPEPEPVNYSQAVNQLTLGFIIEIYASDLDPVDKLGLIAKQIDVWKEL